MRLRVGRFRDTVAAATIMLSWCLVCSEAVYAEQCAYLNDNGQVEYVASADSAPSKYRSKVVCSTNQKAIYQGETVSIARPEEIELDGAVRKASFSSQLGRMNVRWSRNDEKCFGKSPSRAVSEAATAVNRALKSANFSIDMRAAQKEWSLVFIDQRGAAQQFPRGLVAGRHPGFMIPPSSIYLITDFIVPECSGSTVADATLTQVLLHEMGHVLEFGMLGDSPLNNDRKRAEGFASWFEQYSADYASIIPRGSVTAYYQSLAQEGLRNPSRSFSGSAYDYAVSALEFRAVVNRKGISGLMSLYQTMKAKNIPFSEAIRQELRWDEYTLQKEMRIALEKGAR
jgi:hypothetical protein